MTRTCEGCRFMSGIVRSGTEECWCKHPALPDDIEYIETVSPPFSPPTTPDWCPLEKEKQDEVPRNV